MGIHFLNWIVRNILVIQLSGFAEIDTFLTPALVVLLLEDRHIMQHHHRCDVICDHVCRHVRSRVILLNCI